jgi:glutaredoxin
MRAALLVVVSLALLVAVQCAAPKVQVIAYEMSKCPYCSTWKQNFDTQVMKAEGLPDILDIDEEFVATSTTNCLHGAGECVGNKILLCAKQLSNSTDPWGWWRLGVCMQANNAYTKVPDNAQTCASTAGVNWSAINSCANSAQGESLFQTSIQFCNTHGVHSTPTIAINGKLYVGGPPNNLQAVCQAYTGSPKPKGCGNY